MLQENNRYKILKVFFEDPIPEGIGFQLRELSRKVNIAPVSVKKYLKELEGKSLVTKKNHRIHNYPVYYANRNNEYFKFLKKIDVIKCVKKVNLLNYLNENCMPDVIILFGSASKGEDIRGSDLDLFLLSKEKKLNLIKYEKKLDRNINLFFSENFNKLSKELKNSIINGVILKGYLKVF